MPLFLQILEGDSPSTAIPVIATRDASIINAVVKALGVRLGLNGPGKRVRVGFSLVRRAEIVRASARASARKNTQPPGGGR